MRLLSQSEYAVYRVSRMLKQGPSVCTAALLPHQIFCSRDIVRQFAAGNPSTDVSKNNALALTHTPLSQNKLPVWVKQKQRTPKFTGSSFCSFSQDVNGHKSPYHQAYGGV